MMIMGKKRKEIKVGDVLEVHADSDPEDRGRNHPAPKMSTSPTSTQRNPKKELTPKQQ
jgi:hypothetical protein